MATRLENNTTLPRRLQKAISNKIGKKHLLEKIKRQMGSRGIKQKLRAVEDVHLLLKETFRKLDF